MSATTTRVRPPAVAGQFYERDPARLRRQVAECLRGTEQPVKRRFIGAIVPHAGLMYSGHVAGAAYNALDLPRRLIILCPNHTGLGTMASINSSGAWRTPLGDVPVDELLARDLTSRCSLLQEDDRAHQREHSLEVQLPFLQELLGSFSMVPVCLSLPNVDACHQLGRAIAEVMREQRDVAVVASSDLNHYEDQETTLQKDQRAIDAVLALDPRELWRRVREEDISMCGFIPVTTMLFAARELGAAKAELFRHSTSGDINGDYSAVVGYASMAVG